MPAAIQLFSLELYSAILLLGKRLTWFDELVDAGVPAGGDANSRLRARNVVFGSIVAFCVFGLGVVEGLAVGSRFLVVSSAIGVLAPVVGYGVLRQTRNPPIAGHIVLGGVFVVLLMTIGGGQGFSDPVIGGLYTLPIGAALLLSLPAGFLWGAISLAALVAFWILDRAGVDLSMLAQDPSSTHALFSRVSIHVVVVSMIAFFVVTQRRNERRVRMASRRLSIEAANVAILREAAVAANEATTLREAVERCLVQICTIKGWPVAHAHDVTDGSAGKPVSYVDTDLSADARRLAVASARLLSDAGDPELAVAGAGLVCETDLSQSANPYRRALAEELGLSTRLFAAVAIADQRWLLEFYGRGEEVDEGLAEVLANTGTQLGWVLERERSRSRIHDLAYYDSLTGLPNRRHLRESLEMRLMRPDPQGVALLHVGLDRFKTINEALGHRAGDELLSAVADRLVRAARSATAHGGLDSRLVFRLGGDEFALLVELPEPNDAGDLAQRILDRIAGPCSTSGGEVFATASVGIAVAGIDGGDTALLLRGADAALAEAKRDGGNRFSFYSSAMNRANTRRLWIEHQLRRAVSRGELELRYQPIVCARSGVVIAAEALLRWTTAGEVVGPDEFIPVAEATGQIDLIGSWVLRSACSQLASWRERGLDPMRMAVNVSVDQLEDPSFVEMVLAVLSSNKLEPGALELEVTESRVVERESQVVETLRRLHRAGVGIALDDFGTGYSSLGQLRRLPIGRLKIDRSFVSGIDSDSGDVALLEAVIQIGRGLGLHVVAEGIETERQQELLADRGCDELQGYYFAQPTSGEAIEEMWWSRSAELRAAAAAAEEGKAAELDTDLESPVPEVDVPTEREASLG